MVYEHKRAEGESGTFTLAEQHLYGASRIGMTKPNLALNTATPDAASPTIRYELTNHLGNVMAVITDEPTDAETPAVESLADYYPFGMTCRAEVTTLISIATASRDTRKRATLLKHLHHPIPPLRCPGSTVAEC